AVARLEAEHAELEHALERLAALLGTHERKLSPSGKLLPDATPPLDTLLSRLQDRPQLKAWEARAAAADLDGQAARRGWLPDVTLGIGAKRVDDGLQRDKGITFTASIPLPVFDRRQTAVQRATAEAKLARSEYRLNRATTEAEIRGLHQQSERLRNAALEFRAQAVAASSDLIRIATAAYQAGESTLLEMLDAHKGMFDAESAALELEWQARASRIELDQLTGTLAP
ncbi:MAG TPA: TolC family protein, partial [Rhodocyclaceae bacterium]|nr:TolC family protein [Rhodocyclaceae bacterium]